MSASRSWILAPIAIALTLTMAPLASAQEVFIEQVPMEDEPCHGIIVRGSGNFDDKGTLEFYHNLPRPALDEKFEEHPWTGTMDEDGTFSFEEGPFDPAIKDDIYVLVRAEDEFMSQQDVLAVSETFDVICEPSPLECPDVTAEALADARIRLTWMSVDGAASYEVLRDPAPDGSDGVVFSGDANEFVDETGAPGETFRYTVIAVGAEGERSDDCAAVEVTAVPFFGGPVLGGLALLGSVGAMAWLRRR